MLYGAMHVFGSCRLIEFRCSLILVHTKATCLCSVGSDLWDLMDDFASLQSWGGVLHVSQVVSQERVGHVCNLNTVS